MAVSSIEFLSDVLIYFIRNWYKDYITDENKQVFKIDSEPIEVDADFSISVSSMPTEFQLYDSTAGTTGIFNSSHCAVYITCRNLNENTQSKGSIGLYKAVETFVREFQYTQFKSMYATIQLPKPTSDNLLIANSFLSLHLKSFEPVDVSQIENGFRACMLIRVNHGIGASLPDIDGATLKNIILNITNIKA